MSQMRFSAQRKKSNTIPLIMIVLICFNENYAELQVPLCMVDLAQTIEEWKDLQSVKVDDQVCTHVQMA